MKVLVVDDDAGLRKSLSLILEDAEYTVVVANDAEEGLRKARDTSPSLILVDVRMPGWTGSASSRAIGAREALRPSWS